MFKSFKEQSKTVNWGTSQPEGLNIEQVNCGALLRIADATELMAKNYAELVSERDGLRGRLRDEQINANYRRRQISALRGQITRLRKELSRLKTEPLATDELPDSKE